MVAVRAQANSNKNNRLDYEGFSPLCRPRLVERRLEVMLAQLRSGHCSSLRAYRHQLQRAPSPLCRLCDEEPETTEHLLACPPTAQLRRRL